MDWAIQWWALAWLEFGWVRAKEVVPSGLGFGFGLAEVGGVGVFPVNYVAGVESDLGIGVGFCIVEEATAGFEGCLGSFGLGRCDGAQGKEHGVVDGPRVVEEDANDLLDQLQFGQGEWRGIVWRAGELGGFSIVGSDPMVGRVFCFQCGVFEALLCVLHIFGHVHVDGPVLVVPS